MRMQCLQFTGQACRVDNTSCLKGERIMVDVKGRWALITGASRGIGYLAAIFIKDDNVIRARALGRKINVGKIYAKTK